MGKEPAPKPPPVDPTLGQKAVEVGLLTAAQLREVLLELSRPGVAEANLATLLVNKGFLSAAQVDALSGAPPKKLGKYKVGRELGRGGMGVVYEAEDTELGRRVALKMLIGSLHSDPQESALEEERFIREARLSANLPKHPQIIGVYEAGLLDGRRFIAMEYVEAKQFSDWRRQGSITLRQQITVLRDTAMAVDHAHRHGIIHRDLKPANILVDRKNHPHVADFGLAKRTNQSATLSLTSSGMVMGTPAYMSPEQAQGTKEIDLRADLWAMGIMLYEILTGRVPFEADSPIKVLAKILNDPISPPSTIIRGAPAALDASIEAVCMKALSKEARYRYPSARAFADDLGRWLRGERVSVATKTPPAGNRKLLWLAGAAAAVVVAGLVAWFALTPSAEERAAERAQQYVLEGRRLVKDGKYSDALVKFGQALAEDPSNREAATGKKDAENRLVAASRPAPPPPTDPSKARESAQKELAELDTALAALRDAERFGSARDLLTQATRRHPDEEWTTAIAARLETLRKAVDAVFAEAKTKAVSAKKAGDSAAANAAAGRVKEWKWPGLSEELDLELARTRETPAPAPPAPAPPVPAPVVKAPDPPLPAPAPPAPAPAPAGEVRPPAGFRAFPPVSGSMNAMNSMAFSPDGKTLLTTSYDHVVRLWDVASRTERMHLPDSILGRSCGFSPDGKWFAVGAIDGQLRIWDTAKVNGRTLTSGNSQVIGIAFTLDSKSLVVSTVDNWVKVWDVELGRTTKEFYGHPGGALGLALSPDGRYVAVGCVEPIVIIRELATGREVRRFEKFTDRTLYSVCYSPDGKRVAFGSDSGTLFVGSTETGTIKTLGSTSKGIRALTWSPNGKWIATTSEDSGLRIWDPATGSFTGFPYPDQGYYGVAISPKGDFMAAGAYDWSLHFWQLPK
jgi:serine/threonine protein kinase